MMEWVEATKFALKSSIRSELTNSNMKSTSFPPKYLVDDLFCVLPTDDFSVDEFFDVPAGENDDFDEKFSKDGPFHRLEEEIEEENVSREQIDDDGTFSNSSFHGCDSETLSAAELAVPVDDMKELELWSHLMDDSVTETYTYPNVNTPMKNTPMKTGFHHHPEESKPQQPITVPSRIPLIPPYFPVKPRSKRPRTITGRTWLVSSPPKSESDSSSSSSPTSVLLYGTNVQGMGLFYSGAKPPTVKKPKKTAEKTTGSGSQALVVVQQRRCTHCLVTKTPQWRAGPNGPKTLCNACGVRFKSGRLFPEYRPACSPTFSSEMHSNSHRKVLEMRKRKEMAEPEAGLVSPGGSICENGGPGELICH